MITPKLEELILCGKAFFKTAVVGGAKTTIDIEQDRFIIIIDITYLPYYNSNNVTPFGEDANTQVSIYGERGFNHYFFANNRPNVQSYFDENTMNREEVRVAGNMPAQKIDCYLLHTTQVGFSFLTNFNNTATTSTNAIADANNPAFQPPLDYGKEGMPGSIVVPINITPAGMLNAVTNRNTGLGIGVNVTQQVQYPAMASTVPVMLNNPFFPIANINYVEILGQPNNIGI